MAVKYNGHQTAGEEDTDEYMDSSDRETCLQFCFNAKKCTILGRSPTLWFKSLVFYSLLYVVLAALFYICMHFWVFSLSTQEPYYQLDESLIGSNPGVGFRPISDTPEHGSVITYDAKDNKTIERWVTLLDEFLQPYKDTKKLPNGGRSQIVCQVGKPKPKGTSCAVIIDDTSNKECTLANNYGYQSSSPCFVLKLNKIYGWVPEYYNDTTNLPADMPPDLVAYIKAIKDPRERNQVWISCNPERTLDAENLGDIVYVSGRGLQDYYFPFDNTQDYLSPLVFIKLVRPSVKVLINFECRAWAKNINYRKGLQREGSVHIELLID